jgi:hypothetical protein
MSWRFSGQFFAQGDDVYQNNNGLVGKIIGLSPMIFPWKIDGFLWFPVDFPLNQSIEIRKKL